VNSTSLTGIMLWALSVLAAVGLRYPPAMLPLLMWEVTWKGVWMLPQLQLQ
jgi:hypothetical protein